MNITAYSVIVFLDTCLIHEIKMQKSYFEAFRGNLVPQKFQYTLDNIATFNMYTVAIFSGTI